MNVPSSGLRLYVVFSFNIYTKKLGKKQTYFYRKHLCLEKCALDEGCDPMARNPLLSIIMGRGRAGNALYKSRDKKRKEKNGERREKSAIRAGSRWVQEPLKFSHVVVEEGHFKNAGACCYI